MPLLLVGWPILALAAVWLLPKSSQRWIMLALAALLVGTVCLLVWTLPDNSVFQSQGEWIRVDLLSLVMIAAITAVVLPVLLYFTLNPHSAVIRDGVQSLSWLLAMLAAMYGVTIAGNIGLLWVAVEATTICSALLIVQGKKRARATLEAAWKYILICSVGIIFALLGTILFYFAAQRAGCHGLDWSALVGAAPGMEGNLVRLAFVFVLVGYGAKAAIAPMHNWLPDTYSQAPAPVAAILSAIPFGCAGYAVFRLYALVTLAGEQSFASTILIALGLLSVAIAAPFMLVQSDIKRLLAYSSVEHIGLVFLGLGFGGTLGISAALLHLFNHSLAKPAAFLTVGEITDAYGTRKIAKIRGLLSQSPVHGVLYLVFVFALAGMPPLALFRSELRIMGAGVSSAGWFWPALAAALLVPIFAAFLYHSSKMTFGPPAGYRPLFRERAGAFTGTGAGTGTGLWAVALPIILLLYLGMSEPVWLQQILERAAQVVQQGVICP